jgi:2-polyprenyl-3-methyl-5-hydroxy-6-metoxy-1,4-benzoquinol methylase
VTPAIDARRIASVYEPRWLRAYVASKLRFDPVYQRVVPLLVESGEPLLDIGCGIGILTRALRLSGFRASIVGVDLDERKIASAKRCAADSGTDYRVADFRTVEHRGSVTMLDVLHYSTLEEQRAMLAAAASRVSDDGVLLIRDAIDDGSFRSKFTKLEENVATSFGWLRGDRITFPSRRLFEEALGGFEPQISPAWGLTPFNNHLIVARRSPERRSSV